MGTRQYFHNGALFFEADVDVNLSSLVNYEFTKRCPRCKQPLYKGDLPSGTAIEIECSRCKLKVLEIIP